MLPAFRLPLLANLAAADLPIVSSPSKSFSSSFSSSWSPPPFLSNVALDLPPPPPPRSRFELLLVVVGAVSEESSSGATSGPPRATV